MPGFDSQVAVGFVFELDDYFFTMIPKVPHRVRYTDGPAEPSALVQDNASQICMWYSWLLSPVAVFFMLLSFSRYTIFQDLSDDASRKVHDTFGDILNNHWRVSKRRLRGCPNS